MIHKWILELFYIFVISLAKKHGKNSVKVLVDWRDKKKEKNKQHELNFWCFLMLDCVRFA